MFVQTAVYDVWCGICSSRKRQDSTSNWDIKETRNEEENRRARHPSSSLLSFIFLSFLFFRIRFLVASGLSAYTRTTIHSRFSVPFSLPSFFLSSSSSSVYLSFSALLSRFRAFPMRCFNLFFFGFSSSLIAQVDVIDLSLDTHI